MLEAIYSSSSPATGVQVPFNTAALTDGEVGEEPVHIANQSLLKHMLTEPKPLERVLPRITHMLVPWPVTSGTLLE